MVSREPQSKLRTHCIVGQNCHFLLTNQSRFRMSFQEGGDFFQLEEYLAVFPSSPRTLNSGSCFLASLPGVQIRLRRSFPPFLYRDSGFPLSQKLSSVSSRQERCLDLSRAPVFEGFIHALASESSKRRIPDPSLFRRGQSGCLLQEFSEVCFEGIHRRTRLSRPFHRLLVVATGCWRTCESVPCRPNIDTCGVRRNRGT